MGNSYRLRTKIGVDKALNVALEQDFESLEILSLKILQSQIYTRQCSDYGVVVGRVTANNGLGLPNVKVSVFIPLTEEDENNPTISEIYPYKTLNDLNDEGYRYNLLPYEASHGGHTPTGTFPSREDVLTIPSIIEVYDKYYKFTTKTNDSGDYMLFGVPLGTQTIHIDIDLSDIGEFSLAPADLIRLNLATPNQVDGTKFRSSTNLSELPQLKQANRNVEVVPLWGQPEICYLGITRLDFDLSQEFGIKIEPAAVFMGSIISNIDKEAVKNNCKVRKKLGNQCSLTTGPGEILAIRQTIRLDSDGRPALETFELENGGKCIDDNGTWLIDVPMNLDYVYTDEFGNRLISDDPTVGIPTKARYRFKVKWEQPPTLSNEVIRGAFLVPNIKEWGWNNISDDPTTNDVSWLTSLVNSCPQPSPSLLSNPFYLMAKASYAFSLDWKDYGEKDTSGNLTTIGLDMVDEAVNCVDRFYEMRHSKVYTVSQMISEHRGSTNRRKFIGIKDILDETCESTSNRFPANDGMRNADILFTLFKFIIGVFVPIIYAIVIIMHLVSLIICLLWVIVLGIASFVCGLADGICALAYLSLLGGHPFEWALGGVCTSLNNACTSLQNTASDLEERCKGFSLPLPMYTYPDCDMCDCQVNTGSTEVNSSSLGAGANSLLNSALQSGASAFLSPILQPSQYDCGSTSFGRLAAGGPFNELNPTLSSRAPVVLAYDDSSLTDANLLEYIFSPSLPYFERLNLFNTKAKYFDNNSSNPGGGWNRIKCSFAIDLPGNGLSKWHLDNVVILITKPNKDYELGQMLTFNDKNGSSDPNMTGRTSLNQFNNRAITGNTYGTPIYDILDPLNPNDDELLYYQINNRSVFWARPDGTGNNITQYNLTARTENNFAKFPMDTEYFQVIHKTTIGDYIANANAAGDFTTLLKRVFQSNMNAFEMSFNTLNGSFINAGNYLEVNEYGGSSFTNFTCLKDYQNQKVYFLTRGVDPYSTRQRCRFDLSRLYGYDTNFDTTWETNPLLYVEGDFKLNVPINGGFKCVQHLGSNGALNVYSNQYLYYPSYEFNPTPTEFIPFTSTATTTYSRLDADYRGLGGPGQLYPAVDSPSGHLQIINTNWMVRDFAYQVNTLFPPGDSENYSSVFPNPMTAADLSNPDIQFNTLVNGRNRGYFVNEIVEGAGYIYLNGSGVAPAFTLDNVTGDFVAALPPRFPTTNPIVGPTVDSAYLCENYDPATQFFSFTNSQRIVMRSDRLPMSSTLLFNSGNNIPPATNPQSYPLFANNLFTSFSVNDEGLVENNSDSVQQQSDAGTTLDNQAELGENPLTAGVSQSFDCNGLAPLECYEVVDGFQVLKPESDPCWTNSAGENIIEGGCYQLVSIPVVSLPLDFRLVLEWSNRIKLNFAACRNVFGHMFTNQWINGTLFMFPIRNSVRYTPPTPPPGNEPYICACNQLVFPDYDTNVLYYRSSPWSDTLRFIGKRNANDTGPYNPQDDSGGETRRLLQTPTTILDMGPRTSYTSELVLDPLYQGYIMGRMTTTSFKDVSDLLQQFFLSRLLSQSFIGQILSVAGADLIKRFFDSRGNNKIDGDYAQLVAINSQIGIKEFDPDEYLTPDPNAIPSAPNGYVFNNPSASQNNVFGVFFKEEIQLRDWLSPHRLVVSPNGPISNPDCVYTNLPIFSQNVPIYQWEVKPNQGFGNDPLEDSIFGDQSNDWYSDPPVQFFESYYQGFDRLGSDFMHSQNTSLYTYNKAYLFNVNSAGEIDSQPPQPAGNPDRIYTSSGPYYFYFGLSIGKSAFDRFLVKWIKSDVFDF